MNIFDAFHSTVHDAPGGCEALAVRLGMSPVILRNKANPNTTSNKPMLDDVDRIMTLTGDYRILHALASNHGFVCVRVEEQSAPSDMAILEIMAKVWSANGEIGMEVNKALEDGRIQPHEIHRIHDAIRKTERQMHQLLASLNNLAE